MILEVFSNLNDSMILCFNKDLFQIVLRLEKLFLSCVRMKVNLSVFKAGRQ